MRLHLEGKVIVISKLNDSGIIFKNGDAPGFIQFPGALDNCLLQKVVNHFSFPILFILNLALEGFVDTVL